MGNDELLDTCGEAARGVASSTASRALALLDFWLAGPIKPTFQRVFRAELRGGSRNIARGALKQNIRVGNTFFRCCWR